MKTKVFPYNAVGKVQASTFASTMGGSVKNNPGYGTGEEDEIVLLDLTKLWLRKEQSAKTKAANSKSKLQRLQQKNAKAQQSLMVTKE